jgi:hypothetical protein
MMNSVSRATVKLSHRRDELSNGMQPQTIWTRLAYTIRSRTLALT